PNFLAENSEVTAPVVFAGFGITAPELHDDDYASIDARGKIVLMFSGAPETFPTDQRAFYSNGHWKDENAAKHGAAGVITMLTPIDEQRAPFEKRAQQTGIPPMLYLDDNGRPADAIEGIRGAAMVNQATAQRLRDGAHTVTMRTVSQFTEAKSENVIGLLRGTLDEAVVVSAHLDHIGNHPHPSGDSIYNGAYDNASGIACLIEIARTLASSPKPNRSILFVAFTGEEKGDQGSQYFARHLPRPVVADVNMDMFLMLYPVADLVPLGGEHSTLGEMAAEAAKGAFAISPDPFPEEVRFIRSDQFSFVEQGIPAIHLKPGNKSLDPAIDGAKVTRDWLRTVYHSPQDDMSQHFDFDSGARYATVNARLVSMIANAPEPPKWKPGDFFAPVESGRPGGSRQTSRPATSAAARDAQPLPARRPLSPWK
ncbi:MAG TPA: M28 family metallopeptidase, partial [Thermoanaerobaculia bacterium]